MLILTGLGSLVFAVYLIRKWNINRFQMIDDDNFTSEFFLFLFFLCCCSDDTQMILSGKRWRNITIDEYFLAVILLYLDTMLIFFYIFQILSDCDCDEEWKNGEHKDPFEINYVNRFFGFCFFVENQIQLNNKFGGLSLHGYYCINLGTSKNREIFET